MSLECPMMQTPLYCYSIMKTTKKLTSLRSFINNVNLEWGLHSTRPPWKNLHHT